MLKEYVKICSVTNQKGYSNQKTMRYYLELIRKAHIKEIRN